MFASLTTRLTKTEEELKSAKAALDKAEVEKMDARLDSLIKSFKMEPKEKDAQRKKLMALRQSGLKMETGLAMYDYDLGLLEARSPITTATQDAITQSHKESQKPSITLEELDKMEYGKRLEMLAKLEDGEIGFKSKGLSTVRS